MALKNRVVEIRKVKASDIQKNPRNWRLHPEQQRAALSGILDQVGFVGTLVGWINPDGQLELLDGHLRQDIAGDTEVDVAICDLTQDEANLILATYDQVGSMALMDGEQLSKLLDEVEDAGDENAEFRRMFADLDRKMAKAEKEAKEPETEREVDGMVLQPHEHYDFLVVLATTVHEWNVLCDRLGLKPAAGRRGRMGTARAIRAGLLLEKLGNAGIHDRGAEPKADAQHADDKGAAPKRNRGGGRKGS